ncbi:potassium transporter Kup [Aliirhizobium cellulosilyticum]|uniref:Probable potassium transport system protein Kup n=1 Tax=Aliirhizobium cellulosilyticum TaxID=393664 RepID=A0A7W6XBR2_9HYPH|nr:potassium transporter Kup [Rhizobium cellulosilyticum]MBB4349419.1 KUP system potassium uptake protein [Rhizobium cellulosilyticum]MBB4412359.1 KUP system potassium uptake protein [Rhizobium cellulosilyticum]MBB4446991.1 KUP system potassium uptake protein [Rhizobium cellulosilyticum]
MDTAARDVSSSKSKKATPFLVLGAIGVVYGDIGTSPIYAFREALRPLAEVGISRFHVIGVTSLMIWTVTIIVMIKYVLFLLRADNHGEGGTLALVALILKRTKRHSHLIVLIGILGAALFIGDAMITPALSVLSALEGFTLVTPMLSPYLLPLAVAIMVVLFRVQSTGTAAVSKFFGPIMLLWFLIMGLGGIIHIADDLSIFTALNPLHGLNFVAHTRGAGWLVLGAVFLTVTGAEALYTDLAHFGRKPIQLAWFWVVFPSLILNYLGQGALILAQPAAVVNPFFLLYPEWAILPMVLLATMATIIASQAVISGTFSLARQAMNLCFLPPLRVSFTSPLNTGQIYIPIVNLVMAIGVLSLIVIFRSSASLAGAYGLSVTGAMVLTTLLALFYLQIVKGWRLIWALSALSPLIVLETIFFGANVLKIADGGYVPVLIAGLLFIAMRTWRRGAMYVEAQDAERSIPLKPIIAELAQRSAKSPSIVEGTAVFLTARTNMAPTVFLSNLKHNHVLHQRNVILTVRTSERPYIPTSERMKIETISPRFIMIRLTFGYMQPHDVLKGISLCWSAGFQFDVNSTSFYVGRRKFICDPAERAAWQDRLFIALSVIAVDPSDYFGLPSDRVVELGEQITLKLAPASR